MSILYEAGGSQWWCKACKTTVRATKRTGQGYCQCKTVGLASPWKPVCKTGVTVKVIMKHWFRIRRFRVPFTHQKVTSVTILGVTFDWAHGAGDTDNGTW